MKPLVVGVFGATIYNQNLGCQALAWSLMSLIKDVSANCRIPFRYIIFDRSIHDDCNRVFEKTIGMEPESITYLMSATPRLYRIRQNVMFMRAVKQCDLIIDVTQGDSFSDIYGLKRFITGTLEKWYVEHCKVPLLLGPQTYGPFLKARHARLAFRVIQKAELVISRDLMSIAYIQANCTKDVVAGTDVAFSLPYKPADSRTGKRVKIGVNPSGLLWKSANGKGNNLKIKQKTIYRDYLARLMDWLTESGKCEVYLLCHVHEDADAVKELGRLYPGAVCVPLFENAVKAKSYIAQLDCLIAFRMHATIAAFSSGVPVIPVSYSRKFEGLYNTLGYPHVVGMTEMSTDEAVKKTIYFLDHLETLQEDQIRALQVAQNRMHGMMEALSETIRDIAKKQRRAGKHGQ